MELKLILLNSCFKLVFNLSTYNHSQPQLKLIYIQANNSNSALNNNL